MRLRARSGAMLQQSASPNRRMFEPMLMNLWIRNENQLFEVSCLIILSVCAAASVSRAAAESTTFFTGKNLHRQISSGASAASPAVSRNDIGTVFRTVNVSFCSQWSGTVSYVQWHDSTPGYDCHGTNQYYASVEHRVLIDLVTTPRSSLKL